MSNLISHAELLEALAYDPLTGIFTWKRGRLHGQKGSVAGSVNNKGYLYISLGRRTYSSHALAWFYSKHVWAVGNIDHINTIKTDNRLANLREATPQENQRNRKVSSSNKTGLKGVSLGKTGKYRARIHVDGKELFLGLFDSAIAAAEAYDNAAINLFGSFALTNKSMGLIK